jgi:hypothetical protein
MGAYHMTQIAPIEVLSCPQWVLIILCRVKPYDGGILKIRGLGSGDSLSPAPYILGNVSPYPWALTHCVPQHVLHSASLLSHMLWQMLSSFLSPIWVGQRKGTLYIKIDSSIWESLHSFMLFE